MIAVTDLWGKRKLKFMDSGRKVGISTFKRILRRNSKT
jgi:hypothetical protein